MTDPAPNYQLINDTYEIHTRIEESKIIQETFDRVTRQKTLSICDTKDRHIRQKLISMGWIPPEEPDILKGLGGTQKALILWLHEHTHWEKGKKIDIWGLWGDSKIQNIFTTLATRKLINMIDGRFSLSEDGLKAARKLLDIGHE